MACLSPSQNLNQCCIIVNWTLRNKLQSNCIRNSKIFIQENAFENVIWKMSAILSWPQCVKFMAVSLHYGDIIMGAITTQITSLTVYCDADQGKHESSASLAFVWGIHRGPVDSLHKWPVTQKMFPFDDIMNYKHWFCIWHGADWDTKITEHLITKFCITEPKWEWVKDIHLANFD